MKKFFEDKLNAPILEEINLQNNQYKLFSRYYSERNTINKIKQDICHII